MMDDKFLDEMDTAIGWFCLVGVILMVLGLGVLA